MGTTKVKNMPPKIKYIEYVLLKSLIIVHLMIREGLPDVTLVYLAEYGDMLSPGRFSDSAVFDHMGKNIQHYASYLAERALSYHVTRTDWVRAPKSRLEKLSVDKGLLRQTESVQNQLCALVECNILETEPEDEITIAVFRLLVLDLLALFQVLNQGLINILEHFFEMSKPDAERAIDIYRTFTRQTDYVVQYLGVAQLHEHHIRVEIPTLKHVPVNLIRQLEEYLMDPDFEIHRRQYLAEQNAKKKGFNNESSKSAKATSSGFPIPASPAFNNPFLVSNELNTESRPQANKSPDPDLIDLSEPIDQKQIPVQLNPPEAAVQDNHAPSKQPQQNDRPFASNGFALRLPTLCPTTRSRSKT